MTTTVPEHVLTDEERDAVLHAVALLRHRAGRLRDSALRSSPEWVALLDEAAAHCDESADVLGRVVARRTTR